MTDTTLPPFGGTGGGRGEARRRKDEIMVRDID